VNVIRSEKRVIETSSEADTERWGRQLGERIDQGLCISLVGPLGCGKSVLTRGIGRGLGVEAHVVSPSFILVEEYAGRLPLVHCDFYRLEHEDEIEDIGLFDRLESGAVVVAEWGDRSPHLHADAQVVISLAVTGESSRTLTVEYSPQVREIIETS